MSKGEGRNIIVKFTDDLVGDVSDNINAFTITGKEYQWVDGADNNGQLLDKEYQIDKVERYGVVRLWNSGSLQLDLPDKISITDAKSFETTSGTTLTGAVNAEEGDIVLATIAHRSVFTTPIGWTELYESEQAVHSTNQKMVFAIKHIDETGQVGFTAVQSTSNRMYINLISVKNVSEIKVYPELEKYNPVGTTKPIPVPNKNIGESIIYGMHTALWKTSAPYTDWETNPNDLQLVSLNQTVTAPRLANFIDLGNGQATGRTFNHSPETTGTEALISAVKLIQNYLEDKVITTNNIQTTGQTRVRWLEDKPTDTDITIEYTTGQTQGEWIEVSNGDVITSDTNLWFRVTLETTDTSVTPTLQDLWIEEPDAPQDKIRIVMDDYSRFPSVVGNITIEYDASLGNLAGSGGAVESFVETFTPTDLVPEPNPGISETITVAPAELIINHIPISYIDRYAEETITVAPAELTVNLIYVGVINP